MSAVRVRLSGDVAAIARTLRVLYLAAHAEGFEIPRQSGLSPNRRERGYRVFVTLRFPPENTTARAGRTAEEAIRRPAAPAKEAPPVMPPKRLAGELERRLDGPGRPIGGA